MPKSTQKLGFFRNWFGFYDAEDSLQAKIERGDLIDPEQLAGDQKALYLRLRERHAEKKKYTLPALILGRFVAIVYGCLIAGPAIIVATFGLFALMGAQTPMALAIFSGLVTMYINVTGFWDGAPELFDDFFTGRMFKKKDKNGKVTDEKLSLARRMALVLYLLTMATLAGLVTIAFYAGLITSAFSTLGLAAVLAAVGGLPFIVLLAVGFIVYFTLYGADAIGLSGKQNLRATVWNGISDLFNINKRDPLLEFPGESETDAAKWRTVRKVLRILLVLAIIALILFGTYGVGVVGIGVMLGFFGVKAATPVIVAKIILPALMMVATTLYTGIASFRLSSILVLGLQYTYNQWADGLRWTRKTFGPPGAFLYVVGLGFVYLAVRAVLGFLMAEARYVYQAFHESRDTMKTSAFKDGEAFYKAYRFKTDFKSHGVFYNTVAGIKNAICNTVLFAFSRTVMGFVSFTGLPRLFSGLGIFLNKNRKILALANAFNNGAVNIVRPEPALGEPTPKTTIAMEVERGAQVVGGGFGSLVFGWASVTKNFFTKHPFTSVFRKKEKEIPPVVETELDNNSNYAAPIDERSNNNIQPPVQNHPQQQAEEQARQEQPVRPLHDEQYDEQHIAQKQPQRTSSTGYPYRIHSPEKEQQTSSEIRGIKRQIIQSLLTHPNSPIEINGGNKTTVRHTFYVCIKNDIIYSNPQPDSLAEQVLQEISAEPAYELSNEYSINLERERNKVKNENQHRRSHHGKNPRQDQ